MGLGQNALYTAPVALFLAIITWPSGEAARSEPIANEYARVFEGVFPKTGEDGTRISAPTVEGETLIFVIRPSEELSDQFSGAELERLTFNATCESGQDLKRFFKNGGKLRFDIDADGGLHRGEARLSC